MIDSNSVTEKMQLSLRCFFRAIDEGDITTLRDITHGLLRDDVYGIDDRILDQFHRLATQRGESIVSDITLLGEETNKVDLVEGVSFRLGYSNTSTKSTCYAIMINESEIWKISELMI